MHGYTSKAKLCPSFLSRVRDLYTTGEFLEPWVSLDSERYTVRFKRTTVRPNIFLSLLRLCASNSILAGLNLECRSAVLTTTSLSESVHCALKCIISPAEEVISMGSKASAVFDVRDEIKIDCCQMKKLTHRQNYTLTAASHSPSTLDY